MKIKLVDNWRRLPLSLSVSVMSALAVAAEVWDRYPSEKQAEMLAAVASFLALDITAADLVQLAAGLAIIGRFIRQEFLHGKPAAAQQDDEKPPR